MKITIVQSEIEEAIRNHILTQIAVKPGHVITMELRATRGDEGFIANIDISPDKDAPVVTAVIETAPAPATPVTRRPIAPKASPTAEEPKADTVVDDTQTVGNDTVSGDAEPTAAISTGGDRVQDDESLVEGDQPLKPSIFSNLRRPSNQAAEAEAA